MTNNDKIGKDERKITLEQLKRVEAAESCNFGLGDMSFDIEAFFESLPLVPQHTDEEYDALTKECNNWMDSAIRRSDIILGAEARIKELEANQIPPEWSPACCPGFRDCEGHNYSDCGTCPFKEARK